MKKMILIFSLFLSQNVFATDFFSIMDKTIQAFDLCQETPAQVSAEKKFLSFYEAVKLSDAKNIKTNFQVLEFSRTSVTLGDVVSDEACTMHVDVYEKRCYEVYCR